MTLPAVLNKTIEAMQTASEAIQQVSGDFNYLKLSKAGEWLHGAEDEEVAENSVFAISTESFFVGFQAWDDGDLLGEVQALITDAPISRAELEDVGVKWDPMIGFQLKCVEGDDKGLQLIYKTTSKGGIKQVNDLMKRIVSHLTGEHEGDTIPITQLATSSYKHKKYGKIYTPVFELLDWVAELEGVEEPEEPEEAEAATEEVEPEQPEAKAEPTRRRRRRT